MRPPINPQARAAVYVRSKGICEKCHEWEAVHVHHLTYERMGREWPEDLLHICVVCHCAAHPEKAPEILMWELERQAVIANASGRNEQERYDELARLEEKQEEREREREEQREQEHERERERPEPAWNLGCYKASGYSLEDVEQEEMFGGRPIHEQRWPICPDGQA
jgi:hypothetical protein